MSVSCHHQPSATALTCDDERDHRKATCLPLVLTTAVSPRCRTLFGTIRHHGRPSIRLFSMQKCADRHRESTIPVCRMLINTLPLVIACQGTHQATAKGKQREGPHSTRLITRQGEVVLAVSPTNIHDVEDMSSPPDRRRMK